MIVVQPTDCLLSIATLWVLSLAGVWCIPQSEHLEAETKKTKSVRSSSATQHVWNQPETLSQTNIYIHTHQIEIKNSYFKYFLNNMVIIILFLLVIAPNVLLCLI